MSLDELNAIIKSIKKNQQVRDKINIACAHKKIGSFTKLPATYFKGQDISKNVKIGDDCTAIPDKNGGYTLIAAEGIINNFLEKDPWFAGYSAVMVNISDICAMGGLPIAVTDVIYGRDEASLDDIWEGMLAAAKAYDVPIVGGHTVYRSDAKALAVSILGNADNLLSSFEATPGQKLLMAVDMNGNYYEDYPFWNASTNTSSDELQAKITLMKSIADQSLASCAKDISMGGLLGTVAMLGNSSQVGFDLFFDQILPPPDSDWERWLQAFPSFGFILACETGNAEEIQRIFKSQDVHCQEIGTVRKEPGIAILYKRETIKFL